MNNRIKYRHLFDKKTKIYVAVSGGVDSIAAAHFLNAHNFNMGVFHFNHKTSDINDEMQNKVIDFAKEIGVECVVKKRECELDESQSKEAALRDCRIKALSGLGNVVLAHHINDCVESYLMNSFKGIPERVPIPIITSLNKGYIYRPFMLTRKKSFVNYVNNFELNKFIVEDPTNKDSDYGMRNWVRNEIIPTIEKKYKGLTKIVVKKMNLYYEEKKLKAI